MLALTCACATFSNMAGAAGDAPVIKQNVRLLSEPPANYPAAAKAAGHQGVVKLRLPINTEGGVEDAQVIESSRSDLLCAAGESIKSGMSAWF